MAQMNQSVPKHEQKNLISTLMMVGKHDPLVFLGMEDLFRKYFDPLPNVEAQYFDQRIDKMTNKLTGVQHLLSKYQYSQDVASPLSTESVVRFIAEKLDTTPQNLLKKTKMARQSNAEEDSLALILQNYFNDLSTRYWLEHFTSSRLTRDANYMESLMEIQKSSSKEASKLYEQYLPENHLVSLLKEMVLASSQKTVQSLQTTLKDLRLQSNFSSSLSSSLEALEKTKDITEAEQLSREILYSSFREGDTDSPAILNIVDSIRNNKNLPEDFNVFPFDSNKIVPEHSMFSLPPLVRTHLLDLLSRYNNADQPRWLNEKIVQNIRSILRMHDPQKTIFVILDNFSVQSPKEFRKQHLPVLKSYNDQLSQFVQYEEMNESLSALIKERSVSKMMKQALSIIRKYLCLL